jgi:hypothetical protein
MPRVYKSPHDWFLPSDTPDLFQQFHDWTQRTSGVMDKNLMVFSDHLIFNEMDAKTDKPPSFYIVGSKAQSRKKLGNSWADNIRATQKPPVRKLDEITPAGYFSALHLGWNYDIVEIEDHNIRATYKRLITPIRTKQSLKPIFFATLLHFDEFYQKGYMPGDINHQIVNKKARTLH